MTKIPVSIQSELCVCTPINKEVYEHNKNLVNGANASSHFFRCHSLHDGRANDNRRAIKNA